MNESSRAPTVESRQSREDRELMRRVAENKDAQAYEALCRKHSTLLYNLICNICSDSALAEDALQETMLTVWSRASTFDPDCRQGSVRAWMIQIAAHKALGIRVRKAKDRARVQRKQREAQGATDWAEESRATEQNELLIAARTMIQRLPDRDRKLLALYYGSGWSQQKIAGQLDMPQRTVSLRLQQALAELREKLTQAGYAGLAVLEGVVLPEALQSGIDLPRALFERALARTPQTHLQSAEGTWSRRMGMVCIGAVFLGAVGLAASTGLGSSDAKKGPTVIQGKETSQQLDGSIPTRQRFHHVWTFENGIPDAFRFLYGSRSCWRPAAAGRPAVMTAASGSQNSIQIQFMVKIPKRPVECTISCRVVEPKVFVDKKCGFDLRWFGLRQSTWRTRDPFNRKELFESIEIKMYVYGKYIVMTRKGVLRGINEYRSEYPEDYLAFNFNGLDVHQIEIKEIDEVPKQFYYASRSGEATPEKR